MTSPPSLCSKPLPSLACITVAAPWGSPCVCLCPRHSTVDMQPPCTSLPSSTVTPSPCSSFSSHDGFRRAQDGSRGLSVRGPLQTSGWETFLLLAVLRPFWSSCPTPSWPTLPLRHLLCNTLVSSLFTISHDENLSSTRKQIHFVFCCVLHA